MEDKILTVQKTNKAVPSLKIEYFGKIKMNF